MTIVSLAQRLLLIALSRLDQVVLPLLTLA